MINEMQIKNKRKIVDWVNENFSEKYNGREIRNKLSSAVALARVDGRSLELTDIKAMRDIKKLFKEYLQEQTILAKQRNE